MTRITGTTSVLLLVLCHVLAISSYASADRNAQQPLVVDDELDDYIDWLLKGYNVPGLSLAIIDDGKIATKGYGYARLPATPATPDTLWFTASTTKAFTAAAAGIMIEDKKHYQGLKWTSKILDYLPSNFALGDDHITTHVTLEDALSHRSGLPSHDRAYGWGDSLSDMIKTIRYLPMTSELRTVFQYCNIMVMVASQMLEQVAGERLFDVIRRLLWQPIGMRSTFFFPEELHSVNQSDVRQRLARGYYWVDELQAGKHGSHYVPEPYVNMTQMSGAGATVSSVNDYALWVKTMLEADGYVYPINERNLSSPITAEIYLELVKQRIPMFNEEIVRVATQDVRRPPAYALGWMTGDFSGYPVFGHTGSHVGFGTSVWLIPDLRIGVVAMANTKSHVAGTLIATRVFNAKAQAGNPHAREHGNLLRIEHQSDKAVAVQRPDQSHSTRIAEAAEPFLGVFHHPAYGTFNITLAQPGSLDYGTCLHEDCSGLAHREVPDLHVQPSDRIWPYEIHLKHDAGTWFLVTQWAPHGTYRPDGAPGFELGCEEPLCRSEVVMQRDGEPGFAKFEFDPRPIGAGPRFQQAVRFGMHLTDEMDRAATGHGRPGTWEQGVIWFERV